MKIDVRRRGFVRGLLAASVLALAGASGCGGEETTPEPVPRKAVTRKSASKMTSEEIDRFQRAFGYAVGHGYFDVFNDEHYDHHKQRHHGADVQATSPMTVLIMGTVCGHRLLPWHRSFLIEAEAMLQAALEQRNREEGKDPGEAALVFLPYWDAAHEQKLPDWVMAFAPKGGTAIVPPDLPPGHAGYGRKVGDRYDIVFGRWPGKNLVFDTLHTPDYVGRIMAKTEFADFYDALDVTPEIVPVNFLKAQAGLQTLKAKLPEDEAVDTLIAAFSTPPGGATGDGAKTTNALFEIGYRASVEATKPAPDAALIAAVKDVYSLFNFMPHIRMHLWAGGLDPENPDVRGTVTYFNELTVDPVFWMIHGELDRYWYTWERKNESKPPLTGDDAIFAPISASEGAWYGGGKSYTLDDLTRHEGLPYGYDALFEE